MRIVQLVTRRQRRGAEVFAAELSSGLVERGHTVQYAGLNPPPAEPLTPSGAVCDDVSLAAPAVLSPRIVMDLARYLRRVAPDVVQANGGYALKYAVLASRFYRLPFPLVYRNIGLSSDWLSKPGQQAWTRWLLGGIRASASVSTASRDDLVATYGLDPAIAQVIRRGVPMEAEDREAARRSLRQELRLPDDAPVILHVGSLAPEKNHMGLLRITEQVRAAHPNLHLVLVGEGPLRSAVEQEAERLGQTYVLGVRNDVPRLLAAADLLALPSLTEGIPGVILEAGVQSLATVAYDVGGVGEAVRDGETGRLIPSGDEAGFARAVAELLTDPTRCTAMGAQARAFTESDYALARSVDSFERLYRQVVIS